MGCAKCKLLFIFTTDQLDRNWSSRGRKSLESCDAYMHAVLYICKGKFMIPRPNVYTQRMFPAYTPARVAAGYLYAFTNQLCLSVDQLVLLSDCLPKFLLSCRLVNFLTCFPGSWINWLCFLLFCVFPSCFLYICLLSDLIIRLLTYQIECLLCLFAFLRIPILLSVYLSAFWPWEA